MTWLLALFGFSGFGLFFLLIWWLVQQGKKIKEGEYAKEKVILLQKHQRSVNNWAKEVDRLADESTKLKEKAHSDPSLGNVVDILRRAHGSDDLSDS